MAKVVDKFLMPNIDVKFVSYKLLGKHIKGIEREQATAFVGAVEHYLTTTYAKCINEIHWSRK